MASGTSHKYLTMFGEDTDSSDDDHDDRKSKDVPYDFKPGLCVIINNMDFIQENDLPGGQKDEENLAVLFTTLGFKVNMHQNLTGKAIFDTVKSYGAKQHSGAFFLIILSHGTSLDHRPAVIGTDSKAVLVSDLESFFYASNCESLHGKPKIFLIDACRGSRRETTFNPVSASGTTTKNSSASLRHLRCPDSTATGSDSADFLIVYAATDGHVAFTTDRGSYLTQAFVKVVTKANETDSLTDIVTTVIKQVQDRNAHQTVESTCRLTRKYLIKRNTPLLAIQKLQAKFARKVQQWIPVRDATIEEIEKTIEKLKVYHTAHTTGSIEYVLGTSMTIAGVGLAPITGGLSAFLSAGGISLAAVGLGTAASARIVCVKHVQDQLDDDYQLLDGISQTARKLKKKIDDARQKCPSEFASRMGSAGTAAAITVLNVDLEPIDLAKIIPRWLAKGTQTRAIKKLTNIIEQLEEQKEVIEDL